MGLFRPFDSPPVICLQSKAEQRTKTLVLIFAIPFLLIAADFRMGSADVEDPSSDPWFELFQRSPYPYTLPLPPAKATPLDGTYTKFETKETPPVPCRRCPDYAPEGGLWKLNFTKGAFRIFHTVTGWKDMGSFIISGDQLTLANDPVCHEVIGVYQWRLEEGKLILTVIEDRCAIGLRTMNLTKLPWLSCQPPNREAATTDHWPKPAGCE